MGGFPEGEKSRGRWIVALLFAALLFKLAYLFFYGTAVPYYDKPVSDSLEYIDRAESIAAGDWLGLEQGVFYQAPLYSYFLGSVKALGLDGTLWIYLAQAAMGLLILAFVFNIGRRLFSRSTALAATALALGYGPLTFYESKVGVEVLALFLFTAALLPLYAALSEERGGRAGLAASGLLAGFAVLARPNLALVIPFFCLALLVRRNRAWRPRVVDAAVLVLLSAAVVSCPTLHNAVVGGDPVIVSANGGLTFYHGNNPNAGGSFARPPEMATRSIAEQRRDHVNLAERFAGKPLKPSEASTFWFHRGLDHIRSDPAGWLKRTEVKKLQLFINSDEIGSNYSFALEKERLPFLRLAFIPFGLILALAMVGMIASRRDWRRLFPLYGVILSVVATNLVFYVTSRYRLPILPALVLFAAKGLTALTASLGEGSKRKAACLAALAAALWICSTSLLHPFEESARRHHRADFINNEGASFMAAGRHDEAEQSYREALEDYPGYGDALFNLGVLAKLKGRPDEAAQWFRAYLERRPESPDAMSELAGLLLQAGEAAEALALYRKALALIPGDAALLYKAGVVCQQYLDRPDLAVGFFEESVSTNPAQYAAWINLGRVLRSLQRWDDAMKAFSRALHLDRSRDVLPYLEMIRIAGRLGRHAERDRICALGERAFPGDEDISTLCEKRR